MRDAQGFDDFYRSTSVRLMRYGYSVAGTFDETISTYRVDGAGQFMGELRAAVTDCPTQTRAGRTLQHRLLTGSSYGDESLLIEVTCPSTDMNGKPTGGQEVRLVSAVRVGGGPGSAGRTRRPCREADVPTRPAGVTILDRLLALGSHTITYSGSAR